MKNTPSPFAQTGFTIIGGQRETLLDSLRELWRFRLLVGELVRRDLKIRYKNRVGGILWSLFSPLMQVLTITLMVKLFLAPIDSYSAYLMPVMFLWQFFQNTVLDSSNSMINNAQLARKIYFPRAVLPLVTFITNLLHFGISFAFILLYYFVWPPSDPIYPQNLAPKIMLALPCVLGVGVLGLGIGYLMAYLNTLYEDVRFLSITTLGLLFYALPILYPIERVANKPEIFGWYLLNPLAALMVGFQRALMPPITAPKGQPPFPVVGIPWDYLLLAGFSSFAILIVGFTIFERAKWMMMERL